MRTYKLKELLSIKNGKDHKELKNGDIPIFGSGGIMRYGDRSIFNDESILLPRKGTLSNIQYVNKPFWTVDTIYYSIINKELANPFYLFNFLKSLDLSKLNTGTGVPSMTFDSYYNLDIVLPGLDDQKKIASVLSTLDSKIELNNRINDELEAMAKTLYDYWFVQFDFPDENGKPYKSSGGKMVWNEELKREIPEGWEDGTLSDISEIIGGSTPSKAIEDNFCQDIGLPWITPKDLSLNKGKKYITRGEWNVTERGLREASLKIMPPGTVLLSSRAPIGYLAIARTDVTTNQGFKSFIPKGIFNSEFIFYTIQNLVPEIEANSSGSTFKEVSSGTLKTIKTILPKEIVLSEFNEKIKPIFKRQDKLELENQKLAELRDWLLPMMMNGQVKVN
jgi:type I restriction enzyme S subunit